MKRQESLSRTYATALFRQGATLRDEAPLLALAQALKTEPCLMAFCSSPTIPLVEKEALLKSTLGPAASPLVLALLKLLLKHHQITLLSSIAVQLREQWDAKEGVQSVDVQTAEKLTAAQKTMLDTVLAKQFGAHVRASYGTTPDLLGGLVVRSKGLLLDQSVRGRLAAMREKLFSPS